MLTKSLLNGGETFTLVDAPYLGLPGVGQDPGADGSRAGSRRERAGGDVAPRQAGDAG